MIARILVLVGAALLAACGGSVTKGPSAGDGGGDGSAGLPSEPDSGDDAAMCPASSTIPDADVYLCEAGPPGSAGCPSVRDPMVIYPEGCMKLSTFPGGFCSGPCCGPLQCTCQTIPGFDDGGFEFVCPD